MWRGSSHGAEVEGFVVCRECAGMTLIFPAAAVGRSAESERKKENDDLSRWLCTPSRIDLQIDVLATIPSCKLFIKTQRKEDVPLR